MAQWQPKSPLALAVHAAGFDYDPEQDIIYSRMDALQRQFGYAFGYDKSALLMSATIDCEPIFFRYDNKIWMIELWKGQYGIETGCEIGIYNRKIDEHSPWLDILDEFIGKRGSNDPDQNLFFGCAGDSEMLKMSFTLYRDGQKLFTRGPEKHWWLTGFKWGVYSDFSNSDSPSPKELLTMDITITFDEAKKNMQVAFVEALKGMGYTVTESSYDVSFTFDKPKAKQPPYNSEALSLVQSANRQIVATYKAKEFPNNDPNQISDKVEKEILESVLLYNNFFRNVLDREVSDLKDWATSFLGLVGNILAIDESCAVEIDNQSTEYTLRLLGKGVDTATIGKWRLKKTFDLGHFEVQPLDKITPESRGRLYLKDNIGPYGAEGWVKYDLVDSRGNSHQTITFSFGCPTHDDNHVSFSPEISTIYFEAKSDNGNWGDKNTVPSGGHPLYVRFIVK